MIKFDVVCTNKATGQIIGGMRFDTYDEAQKFIEMMESNEELNRRFECDHTIIDFDVCDVVLGL